MGKLKKIEYLFSVFLLGLSAASSAKTLQIIDDLNRPVVGAQVQIGPAEGNPFAGNILTADLNGAIVTPTSWQSALPVTLRQAGFVPVTYVQTTPDVGQLKLSATDGASEIEIAGTLSGYGPIKTDGKIDFGMVMPALKRDQLLHFDISTLISPQVDVIRVLGRELALPSNIVLPRQTESYIFPITLEKPNYRMYVRQPGIYRLIGSHGQFPLKRVVDEIRAGKSIFEVVNQFNFLQSGTVDLDIKANLANQALTVNQIPFNQSISVTAPTLDPQDVMLTVALSDVDGGYLLPSDIKRFHSQESLALKVPSLQTKSAAVSLLMREQAMIATIQREPLSPFEVLQIPVNLLYDVIRTQADQMETPDFAQISLAMHKDLSTPPQFLGLIKAPVLSAGRISVAAPRPIAGVNPVGMYVVYSSVRKIKSGQVETEQHTRLCEIWNPQWADSLEIPQGVCPAARVEGLKYRWEVLFLGHDHQTGEAITHVTRNSTDI